MKKFITCTNVLILICIVIYILNVFVVSPDTGPDSITIMESINSTSAELEIGEEEKEAVLGIMKIMFKVFGFWGGHVNEALGFRYDYFLEGEVWRAATVLFCHAHLPHIVLNMLALGIVGNMLEKKLGGLKVVILFIISGILNSLISDGIMTYVFNYPMSLAVGASGGVFGLIGIMAIYEFANRGFIKENMKTGTKGLLIFYIIFTSCLTGSIWTFFAHLTGFIYGLVLGLMVCKIEKKDGNENKKDKKIEQA